mmetsp:Transcript_25772/g.40224  ORF Transcript_25772/g.40224 Transcript_25772/m.40224 type:complete len:204 (+) Transcript_25772:359-970(+)
MSKNIFSNRDFRNSSFRSLAKSNSTSSQSSGSGVGHVDVGRRGGKSGGRNPRCSASKLSWTPSDINIKNSPSPHSSYFKQKFLRSASPSPTAGPSLPPQSRASLELWRLPLVISVTFNSFGFQMNALQSPTVPNKIPHRAEFSFFFLSFRVRRSFLVSSNSWLLLALRLIPPDGDPCGIGFFPGFIFLPFGNSSTGFSLLTIV